MMAMVMVVTEVAAKNRWHISHFTEQRRAILSTAKMVIGKQAKVLMDLLTVQQAEEHNEPLPFLVVQTK